MISNSANKMMESKQQFPASLTPFQASVPGVSSSLKFLLIILGLLIVIKSNAQPHPNIVFVLSDDHSVPHVGCYGSPGIQTPNLDKFARQGMRFDKMYVTAPQCVPSRASLMSGRSAVSINMTRFSAALPKEVVSYPELLRSEAGYYTGLIGRSFHLDGANMPEATKKVFDQYNLRTFPGRVDYLREGNPDKVLDELNDFLDKRPANKPFFIQVGFSDPHRPLTTFVEGKRQDPKALVLPPHFPDTKLLREDFAKYYDEVTHLDQQFGQAIQLLEKRGLSKNTIIVFMGDNGAALLRGKGTLYEYGLKVPLIVKWPEVVKPGNSSAQLLSGEDIAPTFLDIAGVKPPKEMTGRSFTGILKANSSEELHSYVFAERGSHGNGLPQGTAAFDLSRCVITKNFKLIYNVLWQLPYSPVDFDGREFWKEIKMLHQQGKLSASLSNIYFPEKRPMFELYDLDKDPFEMTNLAAAPKYAAKEKELKEKLQEWMILNWDYLPLPIAKDE